MERKELKNIVSIGFKYSLKDAVSKFIGEDAVKTETETEKLFSPIQIHLLMWFMIKLASILE